MSSLSVRAGVIQYNGSHTVRPSPVVEISAGRGHTTGYSTIQLLSIMEKRGWYRAAVWRTLLLLAVLNYIVAGQVSFEIIIEKAPVVSYELSCIPLH